jgi:hypothetical protein
LNTKRRVSLRGSFV